MRRVSIPIPEGEIDYWVTNAARHFNMTEGQFLMICLQQAWRDCYAKSFGWREFTIIRREYLEKLESQVAKECNNPERNHEIIPGECGIRCVRRNSGD